ncbi:CDC45-like protein [Piedraia hortae CBS 480.64]|uniref:CDC45-like protein n=1 Tax=Piedraia hortae CBS 480.64 TaxID=1314780 RepID=A0A6A7CBB4_9PEZI|nr:CDC45-like protein [Piedraia hortae CBS 480.64]
MYLPRTQLARIYTHLLRTSSPSSPPVVVITALTVDALCAVQIFTSLLKGDFIPHTVVPVSGYAELQDAGERLVKPRRISLGGEGGLVVLIGCGGGVHLTEFLAGELVEGDGVVVWVVDPRRPWNLENLIAVPGEAPTPGVKMGRVHTSFLPSAGVVVWDDGDVEAHLQGEIEAFLALREMDGVEDEDLVDGKRKRKGSWSDAEDERPRQRRKGSEPPPSSQLEDEASPPPSPGEVLQQQKREFIRLKNKYETAVENHYTSGSWTSEPSSSLFFSLASDLGRADNELLWLAIVGVESCSLSPFTNSLPGRNKLSLIKSLLRDEVRRMNPPIDSRPVEYPTTSARSPTDTSIRLSPEPAFILIRHWSLYDSMLHSTYLSTRLHVWNEQGRKRLNKLLAKMGISLAEAAQGYLHLPLDLKKSLNQRLEKFAEQYNLHGLVPSSKDEWGFVRSWGWAATFSAVDVALVVSSILEVGAENSEEPFCGVSGANIPSIPSASGGGGSGGIPQEQSYSTRLLSSLPTPPTSSPPSTQDFTTKRFFAAYDALSRRGLPTLQSSINLTQTLARAVLRTGSALLAKKQIRHLRSFRMAVLRDGPDLGLFSHPGALVRLGGWIAEAITAAEGEAGREGGEGQAVVLGALVEERGVYLVVGLSREGVKGTSKAERKKREEARRKKQEERERKKAERKLEKERERIKQRERREAVGVFESDDEEGSESEESETSDESESEDDRLPSHEDAPTRQKGNCFGNAFQSVVEETNARVRIDSFEHCVVEVKKEDFAGFLEGPGLGPD